MSYPGPNVYPYFSAPRDVFDAMCEGMKPAGRRKLVILMADHMMPLRRDKNGWILTRIGIAMEGRFWHVSNDGKLSYDYKPDPVLFL